MLCVCCFCLKSSISIFVTPLRKVFRSWELIGGNYSDENSLETNFKYWQFDYQLILVSFLFSTPFARQVCRKV